MASVNQGAPSCTGSNETVVELDNVANNFGTSLKIADPEQVENSEFDSALTTGCSLGFSVSDSALSVTEIQTPLLPTNEESKGSDIAGEKKKSRKRETTLVGPGEFESEVHFYPRVLNATIHPLVSSFFNLGNERILARYAHLNPSIDTEVLRQCLEYTPKHFCWAGSDLFHVTTQQGQRQMIIVETNSCPSGQKSMPLLSETDEFGGYRVVLDSAFKHILSTADPTLGDLAVIYDKNHMEASGYCAVMAELSKEKVWLVEYHQDETNPSVRWIDGVMEICDSSGSWHSIRACFRYVTQKPWSRIPLHTKTIVMNEIISCLAGGRNKMMAARAYEFFNAEMADSGLSVRTPDTIRNVTKNEIPLWVDSMGGHAVIKVPYSNAGQGVYTITNPEDLRAFMETDHYYDKFIVQSLVGNASWSSTSRDGKFYHVGTIPNKKNNTFVSDLRMMITGDSQGFRPVSIYGRRARKPLIKRLEDDPTITSWEMLGTNLSVKLEDNTWATEAQRLLLMDRKDFNQLGIGVDDIIDAYVQTILSVIAIDKLCQRLVPDKGKFDFELFKALNPDEALLNEILM